jgi:hypothetical protein
MLRFLDEEPLDYGPLPIKEKNNKEQEDNVYLIFGLSLANEKFVGTIDISRQTKDAR